MSGTTTSKAQPTGKVRVIMYNVGFGDCFLVSFDYTKGPARHVLIDCGTKTEKIDHMREVAHQIATDCQGRLTAIVATHRHSDHVSGFGNKSIQQILDPLEPRLVIQPWTEHPKADGKDTEAPSVFMASGMKFTAEALGYLQALRAAEGFCARLAAEAERLVPGLGVRARRELRAVAKQQVRNLKAVNWLGNTDRRRAYVHAGSKSGLENLLPGVKVRVLGPPTLAQSAGIREQAKTHSEEFWKLQALLFQAASVQPDRVGPLRGARGENIAAAPPFARWWIRHVDRAQAQNVLAIVTAMNDALNNTSVVLLFEVEGKRLLFPGDAQLENWQYVLANKGNVKLIARTNLYKVGHHGSTNATPRKSLWETFANRGTGPDRLITLLPTKHTKSHPTVPRESLVKALQAESSLTSTDGMKDLSFTVTI